jgi:hypothetical protein
VEKALSDFGLVVACVCSTDVGRADEDAGIPCRETFDSDLDCCRSSADEQFQFFDVHSIE